MDWTKGINYYSNIPLESNLVAPRSLWALLHTRYKAMPKPLRNSLILKDTVATRKVCWGLYKLPLGRHPKSPLWNTNSHFRTWESKRIRIASQLLSAIDGRPYTFQELRGTFNLPSSHFLVYHQVIGFFKSRLYNLKGIALSNPFDLLVGTGEERHCLSVLYSKIRTTSDVSTKSPVFTGWGEGIYEKWGKSQFWIMHQAIFGFNILCPLEN